MANTYSLISSNVLSSDTASVTFSAIPATYTDLVLRASVRDDHASTIDSMLVTINGSSSAIYSFTRLSGNGAAASSAAVSSNTVGIVNYINANTSTTNTFSSIEIYIPSYTANQNKPYSIVTSTENNVTTAWTSAIANLFSSTSAITSIGLAPSNGTPLWLTGSSFYLYGIKSS